MKHLELFSGTHSFSKVSKKMGYEVVSLDIDGRASINCDILEWDYKIFPPQYFDLITASPPCDDYSILNNMWKNSDKKDIYDLRHADAMVLKTLEIIDYFKPTKWIIENPQTSRLKSREFMKDLKFNDADYCIYGYNCRKRTRFWNNINNLKLRMCKKDCNIFNIETNKHPDFRYLKVPKGVNRLDIRHQIPEKLIENLLGV